MYSEYFGLKEKPFTLTPNPAFLFLSKVHKEALAHLLYGIQNHAGFIELTGEVGTGKTTVLRSLLNQLDTEDYRLAFIFNPSLTAVELLQSICREFGLPAENLGAADLHANLNRFLLDENQAGRTVLLVIDEAQNLQPEVLEQIRLLSNLETETDKLIQILLVGQPELAQMLESPNLRQLSQRITVRYHLHPLDEGDTRAYIAHRLEIAGGGARERLFKPAVVRRVFRLSGGYPRLINVLCDRTLLAAFGDRESQPLVKHLGQAVTELQRNHLPAPKKPWGVAAALVVVVLIAAGLYIWARTPGWRDLLSLQEQRTQSPVAVRPATPPATGTSPDTLGASAAQVTPSHQTNGTAKGIVGETTGARKSGTVTVAGPKPKPVAAKVDVTAETGKWRQFLADQGRDVTTSSALQEALAVWGVDVALTQLAPDQMRSQAKKFGLELTGFSGSFRQMLASGVPGIVECWLPGVGGSRYFALLGSEGGLVRVNAGPGGAGRMSLATLEALWTGRGFLVWKNFDQLPFVGRRGVDDSGIGNLQKLLRQAGFRSLPLSGRYDQATIDAVAEFQRAVGIAQDGRIGPQTLLLLYRAAGYPQPKALGGEA